MTAYDILDFRGPDGPSLYSASSALPSGCLIKDTIELLGWSGFTLSQLGHSQTRFSVRIDYTYSWSGFRVHRVVFPSYAFRCSHSDVPGAAYSYGFFPSYLARTEPALQGNFAATSDSYGFEV